MANVYPANPINFTHLWISHFNKAHKAFMRAGPQHCKYYRNYINWFILPTTGSNGLCPAKTSLLTFKEMNQNMDRYLTEFERISPCDPNHLVCTLT